MTQKQKTHHLAVAAMLTAVAAVLQFVEFSIPLVPSFIKLDISDLPALLGTDGIWLAVTAAELAALGVSTGMFIAKDKAFHYRTP